MEADATQALVAERNGKKVHNDGAFETRTIIIMTIVMIIRTITRVTMMIITILLLIRRIT